MMDVLFGVGDDGTVEPLLNDSSLLDSSDVLERVGVIFNAGWTGLFPKPRKDRRVVESRTTERAAAALVENDGRWPE